MWTLPERMRENTSSIRMMMIFLRERGLLGETETGEYSGSCVRCFWVSCSTEYPVVSRGMSVESVQLNQVNFTQYTLISYTL
jgi:hypothetical protein